MEDKGNNPFNQSDDNSASKQEKQVYSNDKTYWESNLDEQASGIPIQQPAKRTFSQYLERQIHQQTANPDSEQPLISQFIETSDQPSFSDQVLQQPEYHNLTSASPPKKKIGAGVIALIAALLILIAGAGTAYALRDSFIHLYARTVMDPVQYYAFVEKMAIRDAIMDYAPYFDANTPRTGKATAYDISTDVKINEKALDSLLQTSIGTSLSDLENELGITFDDIGLDALIATDGSIVNENYTVSLNQVELITAELFLDPATGKTLFRFPKLSDAYLSLTQKNTAAQTTSVKDLLTQKRIADLITRYSNIAIDHITRVERKDNVQLSLDNFSTLCTELDVTITEADAYQMLQQLFTKARDDQDLLALLPIFHLSKETYQAYINQALTRISASYDNDNSLLMKVYVDSNGHILGREIGVADSADVISYIALPGQDNTLEYKILVKNDTGAGFMVNGNQSKDQDAYSGNATVFIKNGKDDTKNLSLDIIYHDLRTERKDGINYQYGDISISSMELMGLSSILSFDVEDGLQTSQLSLIMGSEVLFVANSQLNYIKDYQLATPSPDAVMIDINEADRYLSGIDLEGYLANLSDQLGVDLQSIYDYYFYNYTN